MDIDHGPVVQSVVSLTRSLRVILLTILADSMHNILILFAENNVKNCKSYAHFFSEKIQHICVSLDVNFNESLTNDIVSFEQLGPSSLQEVTVELHSNSVTWSAILSQLEKVF